MRKAFVILSQLILFSILIYADVYVKGTLHFHAFYTNGVLQSEDNADYEWWITRNKTIFSTPKWRFILNKEKNQIFVLNLREKLYVNVSLPMNLILHVDKQLAESLNEYQINGKVNKTGEKRNFFEKICDIYKISEWIIFQNQRFYERERTIAVTKDIPFNWKSVDELYSWIRSFFNPEKTYRAELCKIDGFILASDDIRFQEGDKVQYNFKVKELQQMQIPEVFFSVPEDYQKKEKFSREELIDIRTTIYFYYQ